MNMQQQFRQKPSPIVKTVAITLEQAFMGCNQPIDIERIIYEGRTRRLEREVMYVPIPSGVDNNEITIIKDKGNVSQHGVKGDVKVVINLINNTDFKRDGLNLIYKKKISLKDALCGFKFNLKYINGKTFKINNAPGNIINPNFNKEIPNLGLVRDNHKGNLIIDFEIEFPETLSGKQREELSKIL